MKPNVLILGQSVSDESEAICRLVDSLSISVHRCTRVAELSAVNNGWFPDLVVVLQHWSDEFSHRDIAMVLAEFPLARCVCCYGTWCESDGRNRPDAWPIASRVPMRRACSRIHKEFRVLSGQTSPLPLTAARDEVFSFDFDDACGAVAIDDCTMPSRVSRNVLVSSPDRAFRSMISAAVAGRDTTLVSEPDCRADIVLFDADPWTHRQDVLASLLRQHPQARVLALMTMTELNSAKPVLGAGVDDVLPKFAPLTMLMAKMTFEDSPSSV